ncbi:MAG: acyl--CoA ligase [Halioglobus sp.]|nr:acyl--CoA ligase [Halioglobus sp.]
MCERDLTLRDLLHRAAHNYPDNEAVADGVFRYTYAGLLDRVQRMAKLLHERGVRKGDRVALLLPACSAHLIALFGAIELGAIPCALHVRESESILGAILQRLSARVLVCDGAYEETAYTLQVNSALPIGLVFSVSGITPETVHTGGSESLIPQCLDSFELDFEPMPLTADDVAVIALSSGTTGIPKGVMHTHRTLVASARCGAPYMLADERACTINIFSTAFIGWYNCTLPFLYGASKIIYLSRWEPSRYLQTIEQERATVCFLVPTMWRMLLREEPSTYDLSSLRRVGYAGEPMDGATMARIRKEVCNSVLNTYGTTETGSWGGCTVMLPGDYANDNKLASVGRPGEGVEIRVIVPGSSTDDEVARGEEGEVIFSGPSVASQLWEQPQLSRRIFDGRWWRSGDLGYLDEDGYLYLSGRIDDMIISGGINILPGTVEAVLLGHRAVSECVVIGIPDDRYGQAITAFVLCQEPVSEQELAEHVAQSSLSGYKKPRRYVFVDELPRGNTGKVSRKLLRDKVLEGDRK